MPGNFKIGGRGEESRGVMEEGETDWADEKIDNSRAFGAVFNVLMLRLIQARWFLRAGDPLESDQREPERLLLLQRPCQSSIMS